jgi:hypothetical protein
MPIWQSNKNSMLPRFNEIIRNNVKVKFRRSQKLVLLGALQLAGDDRVAPSLVFPLVNLFECSQDRGTFTMLVQNSKLGATWEEVLQFMMEQGGKHTCKSTKIAV